MEKIKIYSNFKMQNEEGVNLMKRRGVYFKSFQSAIQR